MKMQKRKESREKKNEILAVKQCEQKTRSTFDLDLGLENGQNFLNKALVKGLFNSIK